MAWSPPGVSREARWFGFRTSSIESSLGARDVGSTSIIGQCSTGLLTGMSVETGSSAGTLDDWSTMHATRLSVASVRTRWSLGGIYVLAMRSRVTTPNATSKRRFIVNVVALNVGAQSTATTC